MRENKKKLRIQKHRENPNPKLTINAVVEYFATSGASLTSNISRLSPIQTVALPDITCSFVNFELDNSEVESSIMKSKHDWNEVMPNTIT